MPRPPGSTRHDAPSLQPPQSRAPLPLATGRPCRCLSGTMRFATDRASITAGSQTPIQPDPTLAPHHQPSLLSSPLPAFACQSAHYGEIPVALAAPSSPHYSRVPSPEAFGRRPRCPRHRRDGPASETLHIRRQRLKPLQPWQLGCPLPDNPSSDEEAYCNKQYVQVCRWL